MPDGNDRLVANPPADVKPKKQRLRTVGAWARRRQMRAAMATNALEIAQFAPLIHYSQARPVKVVAEGIKPAILRLGCQLNLDCSGLYIWCAQLAGLPDPSGFGYQGWGNTWTIRGNSRKVTVPAPGDAAFYANAGHIVVVVGFVNDQPVADPHDVFVVSHGSEGGPYGAGYTLRADYRTDFDGFWRPKGLS